MKLFSVIVCGAAVALAAGSAAAQDTITQWTFNTPQFVTSTIYNNPAPTIGYGTAIPLGMTNNYNFSTSPPRTGSFTMCDCNAASGTPASGDPVNPATNNLAWRVRGSYDTTLAHAGIGWANQAPEYTQGAEFDVSTVNYTGISFSFDWGSTGQCVRDMQVQYWTGVGPNPQWINAGPPIVTPPNAWTNAITYPLSGVLPADANDNPNFKIRMVSIHDQTHNVPTYASATLSNNATQAYNNASGNWRFDRVTFTGTAFRAVSPSCTGSVSPIAACSSGGPLTFFVQTQGGALPASTSLSVTADLSNIGIPGTSTFYDDGTHGDLYPGDGTFSLAVTVPAGQPVGPTSIIATVTDQLSRSGSTTIPVTIANCGGSSAASVVITDVYGAGGHLGQITAENATYDADFVQIYNRSNADVNLGDSTHPFWSVQYSSPASLSGFDSSQDQVILSGVIHPGQYMLVRMSDPVTGWPFTLPTPDFAQIPGFGGMGNTGGRVALVRSTTLLGTNYHDASIEDFVGYGSSATAYEGDAPTPTPSPASNHGASRKFASGVYQDSNQNFNDFTSAIPTARNRSSGGFLAGYASIDLSTVCAGNPIAFKVVAIPSNTTTTMTVTADVSEIVGSPTTVTLLDDGAHGDGFPSDNTFGLVYTVPSGAAQGIRTVRFTVTDPQGHSDTSKLTVAVGNCQNSTAPVVISQIYGGGGNASSGFSNDYAEIFNRSNAPVNLTGWSFQSARVSDLGFDDRIVYLSGIIQPGEYELIPTNATSSTGTPLPPSDFVPATLFGMESSHGRVALVSTQNLIHTDYTRSDVVDLVGYGVDCQSYEGIAPIPNLSDITVAVRKQGGCQDTNQNAADFDVILTLVLPHNSASPHNVCPIIPHCGSADFNCDGDVGTDADIEAFFACLGGSCPAAPCTSSADFNADGDVGTDADIEAFFRVLGGGTC